MEHLKARLVRCASKFFESPGATAPDEVLQHVFTTYPQNTTEGIVRMKVAVLNTLYATNVRAVGKIARHITTHGQELDRLFESGDVSAVDIVRRTDQITTSTGKPWDFYSFATKYCHWHRPDAYPIYDSRASKALEWLNKQTGFVDPNVFRHLSDYSVLKCTVDHCRSFFAMDRLGPDWQGYRRLDRALYWLGGELLTNHEQPESVMS